MVCLDLLERKGMVYFCTVVSILAMCLLLGIGFTVVDDAVKDMDNKRKIIQLKVCIYSLSIFGCLLLIIVDMYFCELLLLHM